MAPSYCSGFPPLNLPELCCKISLSTFALFLSVRRVCHSDVKLTPSYDQSGPISVRKPVHGFLLHPYSWNLQITGLFWDRDSYRSHWAWTQDVVWSFCFSLFLTMDMMWLSVFEWQMCAIGSIAQRSLCPQMSRETRNVTRTGLLFQQERWNTHSSTQKSGNW